MQQCDGWLTRRTQGAGVQVGELVKLQAVETKGVERKLLRLFDGPYEVLGKDSPTEYTIQKVGEGKRVKVRVHVDRLGVYNDLMEMDVRSKSAEQDDEAKRRSMRWRRYSMTQVAGRKAPSSTW